jgi:hypothetical protein
MRVGLHLRAIGFIGLPMAEPMLVGVLALLWTKASGDDCQSVRFDDR